MNVHSFIFLALVFAAAPSSAQQPVAIRAGYQTGLMDGHLKVPWRPRVKTDHREQLAFDYAYARGYAEGRLEARRGDAGVMMGWGAGLVVLAGIGALVAGAFFSSRAVQYEDVFPFSIIMGSVAVGLGAQELAVGLPLFVGGLVKWLRADRDLARLAGGR